MAAGRYVRRILPVGAELVAPVEGTVVKVHPATVEIRRPDGVTMHVSTAQLLDAPIEFRRNF